MGDKVKNVFEKYDNTLLKKKSDIEYGFWGSSSCLNFSDDIWKSINRKLARGFSEQGILKSFRDIKKMDRIDITGVRKDGHQRMIWNEIKEFEGEKISFDKFHLFIPFIKEGVLVYETADTTFYNHFDVTNVDYENQKIEIECKLYKFGKEGFSIDSVFPGIFEVVNEPGEEACINVGIGEVEAKNDFVEKLDLDKIDFTQEERDMVELYKDIASRKWSKSGELESEEQRIVSNQFSYLMCSFAGINYYLEKEKAAKGVGKDAEDKRTVSDKRNVIISDNLKAGKDSKRKEVVIGKGIKISQGEDSKIKIQKGVVVNRHTDVWGVAGHMRHYKNGRTVYIKPYKKGPGRETKVPEGKTYKIMAVQQKDTTTLDEKIGKAKTSVLSCENPAGNTHYLQGEITRLKSVRENRD